MSKYMITIDGAMYEAELRLNEGGSARAVVEIDGATLHVNLSNTNTADQVVWALVDGRPYDVVLDRQGRWLRSAHGVHQLELRDARVSVARPVSGDGRVKAPIPGLISRVHVAPGDQVEAGQSLLVLEAMKMENELRAPRAGVVQLLNVAVGQSVALHEVIAEIV